MVSPEWQGAGLGTVLCKLVLSGVRRDEPRGVRGFARRNLLPRNAVMLRLAARAGYDMTTSARSEDFEVLTDSHRCFPDKRQRSRCGRLNLHNEVDTYDDCPRHIHLGCSLPDTPLPSTAKAP